MILCFILCRQTNLKEKRLLKEKIKHFRTIYSNVNVDPNIQSKVGLKKNQLTQGIVYLIFV